MEALENGRRDYEDRKDHLLKYIRHPEALAEVAVDPLTDDPEVRATHSLSTPRFKSENVTSFKAFSQKKNQNLVTVEHSAPR